MVMLLPVYSNVSPRVRVRCTRRRNEDEDAKEKLYTLVEVEQVISFKGKLLSPCLLAGGLARSTGSANQKCMGAQPCLYFFCLSV